MMKKIVLLILVFVIFAIFSPEPTFAQSSDTYWNMAGANPERTSWVNQNISTGGFGVIWSLPIEAYIDQKTQIVSADSDSADTIYVATARGLYAIQASNGNVRWKFNTNVPIGHTPTVIGNVIYFGSYDKKVYALQDNTTGYQTLWSREVDSGISTNPIVENGNVFIGSRGGYFYALNASNGSIAWQYPASNAEPLGTIAYSAASDGTNLYFATNDNYAYALNATSGSLVWKSSQTLPGERLESWWPVILNNLVIYTLGPQYRSGLHPGNYTINSGGMWTNGSYGATDSVGVEKRDLSGLDDSGYYGDRLQSSGDSVHGWPSGTNLLDTQSASSNVFTLQNYYVQKPYRKSFIAFNKTTGQEAEIVPISFQGTTNGMHYPPLVNQTEGSLYAIGGFQDIGQIPRSLLFGWKPGNRYLKEAGNNFAIDEPVAFSASGNTTYFNLCCDRSTNFWPYFGGDPGPLATLSPGYDTMWEFFNGPGTDRLTYVYAGLIQNYNFSTAASRENGVYNSHGNQNPLVPYAQKFFTHRSNAIIAIGPNGATLGNGRSVSPRSAVTISSPTNTVAAPDPTKLRTRLNQEISKVVNAGGFLKPGFYNPGQFWGGQYGYSGGVARDADYFSNPGDTLWVLSYAYHQLSDATLKNSLKTYLQNFVQTYFPLTNPSASVARIGWTSGVQRSNFFPPDLDSMSLPGDVTGFELRSTYGLYHYARLFDPVSDQATLNQIYSFAQAKLNTGCTTSFDANKPWILNGCIAHLQGYLNLQRYLNQPDDPSVVSALNTALSNRTNNFSKDFPSPSINNRSKDRKFNISRNWMYLVPELGQYWRNNTTVQNAIREYEYLGPFWFVAGNDNAEEESIMHPLYDTWMFQAKAHAQNLTGQELYAYLDAPAFYRGDLYYINNLATVIERLDPSFTPPPTASSTPSPLPPIPGDANGDRHVDGLDYVIWLNHYNTSTSNGATDGDFSNDGSVDGLDYVVWLNNYGT